MKTQNLLSVRTWEFKSPRPHHRLINALDHKQDAERTDVRKAFLAELSLSCPYRRKFGSEITPPLGAT